MKSIVLRGVTLAIVAILAALGISGVRADRPPESTAAALQTPATRRLRQVKQPNMPLELVEVKYDGAVVKPDSGLPEGGDWTAKLAFTLKNVSDRPITYFDFQAYTEEMRDGRRYRGYTLQGSFGPDITLLNGAPMEAETAAAPRIQPGETVTVRASPELSGGSTTSGTGAVRFIVIKAIWDNDDSVIWHATGLQRKVSPTRWEKIAARAASAMAACEAAYPCAHIRHADGARLSPAGRPMLGLRVDC